MKYTAIKWKLAQWLEYNWWQAYLRKKTIKGYLDQKSVYWRKVIDLVSPFVHLLPNLQILDAGCGPAGIFMVLENNQVFALDPLLHKYKNLPHFLPNNYPWTTFLNQPIESINLVSKFDVIFCINAINHVRDLELCYDKLIKSLNKGGVLVISTDCHRYDGLKKIFQLLPGDMLHPIQLNLNEYNQKLVDREMEIVEVICMKKGIIFDYNMTIAVKK